MDKIPKRAIVGVKKTTLRKERITIESIPEIQRLAGLGLSIQEICHVLDISDEKLRVAQNKNPELKMAIQKGRAEAKKKVVETCFDMASSGSNFPATAFWLKARAGWRDHDPNVNLNFTKAYLGHDHIDDLSADDLEDVLAEAMRNRGFVVEKNKKEIESGNNESSD